MTTYYTEARLIAYIDNEKIDKAIPFIEKIATKIMDNDRFLEHRFYSNAHHSKTHKKIVWELNSGVAHDDSLSDHIKSLLDMVEDNEANIRQLAEECALAIICYYKSGYPDEGLFLSKKTLLRLSKFPLDISFDLFE